MSAAASSDELQVRSLVERWAGRLRAKDVEGVLSHYAPEIVSFDLAPPLHYAGMNALRENLSAWFPTFRGPVGYEVRDLVVTASTDLAFCRSLNRISGARTDGTATDVWIRMTLGCRKIDGGWKIVHEHASVPFYMDGSYKAATDLAPEGDPS
ncbi:MAG TPA: nuclear transport factor 2 family protein [Alphaproteobacteria bacterium]